jgi:phage-related protein
MSERTIVWLGTSLTDLRVFPDDARRDAGYQLRRVQSGQMPSDWKVLSSVGPGVYEIRVHTGVEHRVFYVAKFSEAIYVLHAFEKKTRQTRSEDIDVARHRFAWLKARRRVT